MQSLCFSLFNCLCKLPTLVKSLHLILVFILESEGGFRGQWLPINMAFSFLKTQLFWDSYIFPFPSHFLAGLSVKRLWLEGPSVWADALATLLSQTQRNARRILDAQGISMYIIYMQCVQSFHIQSLTISSHTCSELGRYHHPQGTDGKTEVPRG